MCIYIYTIIRTIFIYTSGIALYCLQPNLIMRIKTTLPPTFRPTIKFVLDSSPDHWKTSRSTNQTWPLQVQNAPDIVSHSFDLPGTSWRSPGKLLERLAAVAAAYQSLGDTSPRNALRHLGCCQLLAVGLQWSRTSQSWAGGWQQKATTGPKKYESSLLNGEVYFCLHPSWQANLPGNGVQRLCFQVFDPYPIIDTLGVQSYIFLFVTHLPATKVYLACWTAKVLQARHGKSVQGLDLNHRKCCAWCLGHTRHPSQWVLANWKSRGRTLRTFQFWVTSPSRTIPARDQHLCWWIWDLTS